MLFLAAGEADFEFGVGAFEVHLEWDDGDASDGGGFGEFGDFAF